MAIKRFVGFGKETTFGTKASAPKYVIDPKSADLAPSGNAVETFAGASGLDNIAKATKYATKGKFEVPLNSETFGQLMYYTLGSAGYTKSGTAPTITHTFVPAQAQLMDSFTAFIGKDVYEEVVTGCSIDSIDISVEKGIITASGNIVGGQDTKGDFGGAGGRTLYTGGKFYSPQDTSVLVGGTDTSAKIEGFKISINTNPEQQFAIGSQFPARNFRGALEVTGEFTLSFFDTVELERFWGGTTGRTNTVNMFNVTFNIGTELDIILPNAVYMNMSQPLAGRGRVQQTAQFKGLMATDGTGPVQVVLTNAVTDYGV